MWAAAEGGWRPGGQALAVLEQSSGELLEEMAPQALAVTLWALARLGWVGGWGRREGVVLGAVLLLG